MAKKAKSPSYATYKAKGSFSINKKRKIERHLKKHPNDAQTKEMAKQVPVDTTRKTPKAKHGWTTEEVRGFLSHAPHLTPFQGKVYNHQVAPTKTNLKYYAKMFKFLKALPFQENLVPEKVYDKELGRQVTVYNWKHTSKLSNFSGKEKAAA